MSRRLNFAATIEGAVANGETTAIVEGATIATLTEGQMHQAKMFGLYLKETPEGVIIGDGRDPYGTAIYHIPPVGSGWVYAATADEGRTYRVSEDQA